MWTAARVNSDLWGGEVLISEAGDVFNVQAAGCVPAAFGSVSTRPIRDSNESLAKIRLTPR